MENPVYIFTVDGKKRGDAAPSIDPRDPPAINALRSHGSSLKG
jgi:hypothetical protein